MSPEFMKDKRFAWFFLSNQDQLFHPINIQILKVKAEIGEG